MLLLENLIKIEIDPYLFIKWAIEENLGEAYTNNQCDSKVFSYLEGINRFSKAIDFGNSIYKKISIYSSKSGSYYYLVNERGLIFSYIYGPISTQKQADNINNKKYFGHILKRNDNNQYVHSCIPNFTKTSINAVNQIGLYNLKTDYLPLPSNTYDLRDIYFYEGLDSNSLNNIIFLSPTRSFYLPLYQLLAPLVDDHANGIKVKGKYEPEFIKVFIERFRRSRKYDYYTFWEAKVTYATFEVYDFKYVAEESDYKF